MSNDSRIINFHDYDENQKGFVAIRTFNKQVVICLALEEDGEIEARLEKDIVRKIIIAIQGPTGLSTFIDFYDSDKKQNGFVVIRIFDKQIAICLAFRDNGDIEAILKKDVARKLFTALQDSIGIGVSEIVEQNNNRPNEQEENNG